MKQKNDLIRICMEQADWERYRQQQGESNRACLEAIKYVMPIVMEHELQGDQRECVRLHYFEHMSQNDIAQQMGVTQPTVSRKLKSARKRLKKYLTYSFIAADKMSALLH